MKGKTNSATASFYRAQTDNDNAVGKHIEFKAWYDNKPLFSIKCDGIWKGILFKFYHFLMAKSNCQL
jgi:hypothetical protein